MEPTPGDSGMTIGFRAARWAGYGVLVLAGLGMGTPDPITVSVMPRVQLSQGIEARASVWVRLAVRPDPQNRLVCVDVDGPTFRSSCWTVDGERAPYREEWLVKNLQAGEYTVVGEVERADKSVRRSLPVRFCIAGESVESECFHTDD